MGHTLPQPPQLETSELESTQVPPQSVKPGKQAQVPREHISPKLHRIPQPPQLVGSVATSAQPVPQLADPSGHWQTPPAQELPPVQAWPQAPQLSESLSVLVHVGPQTVSPFVQFTVRPLVVVLVPLVPGPVGLPAVPGPNGEPEPKPNVASSTLEFDPQPPR